MKTTNETMTDRPRLTCRVVQGWTTLAGDGAAPRAGTWAARHAAGCACCNQFFDTGRELDAALRRAAPVQAAPAGPELEQGILAAVARARREEAPRRSATGWGMGAWALAGAAATLTVGALVLWTTRPPEARATRLAVTQVPRESVRDGTTETVADFWQSDAGSLLGGEPLQREVDAVYSNARSALGFLAMNFLPSTGETGAGVVPAAPARRPASG